MWDDDEVRVQPGGASAPSRREFLKQTTVGLGVAAGLGPSFAVSGAPTAARPSLEEKVSIDGPRLSLGNGLISGEWDAGPTGLRLVRLTDVQKGRSLAAGLPAFSVTVGGTVVDSGRMKLAGAPRVEELAAVPGASRLSERLPGKQLVAELAEETGKLTVTWRAVLRDGSAYLRQELTITARGADVNVTEVCPLDLRIPGGVLSGNVKGSPVTAGTWFFSLEHPLSTSWVSADRVRCALGRALPLKAGQSLEVSRSSASSPEGQLRRGFLGYLERERAHPYRPFLHYNSWYDLGYFTRFDEAGALAVIQAFGEELHVRRGVTLDSFLFDDGWDDPQRCGASTRAFPRLHAAREAAASYGAAPGVWLSPWGGYGKPKQERHRVRAGRRASRSGQAASRSPARSTTSASTRPASTWCAGTASTSSSSTAPATPPASCPGSAFGSDFEAAISLIGDLRRREARPLHQPDDRDVPVPLLAPLADSIWRGGEDHDFTGVGTDRQRWITYRDADTYEGVRSRGASSR